MAHNDFGSALILLLLILDPFGNLPFFIAIMRQLPKQRRLPVALREIGIAYVVLLAFMWGGQGFLRIMGLSQPALEVAGGVILLLVAIKMIFSSTSEIFGGTDGKEPMVFPLAVPLLAGPSALATVLLLTSRQPGQMWTWVAALTAAIVVTGGLLLMAETLLKWVGDSVMRAGEKLMGLILTAIAVNMLLGGLRTYFLH
ncbi:MAG: MarC family protein [Betaproteobacteria bacterium]|jgi:MarC family membrane protein|nr:MarC family protein [Betaproteobacteria bacterium]MDE2122861.1 MarC family protein [Betaproteobacteria bacterium]MDE2187037.1 MarC family protein [Betaproteobacteria bacterium]MDE2324946.1 MarC family protein [Betaproteobacteria bacterium]NNM63193.1 MarC family protein [Burkholderiales bacterium]